MPSLDPLMIVAIVMTIIALLLIILAVFITAKKCCCDNNVAQGDEEGSSANKPAARPITTGTSGYGVVFPPPEADGSCPIPKTVHHQVTAERIDQESLTGSDCFEEINLDDMVVVIITATSTTEPETKV